MHLSDLISIAIKNQFLSPPKGSTCLKATFSGQPSHWMSNALAAFRAEMEDILCRPLDIVGGGSGCVCMYLGLGNLNEVQINGLQKFVSNKANLEYFKRRYRVQGLSVDLN